VIMGRRTFYWAVAVLASRAQSPQSLALSDILGLERRKSSSIR
jgi:hypothetical protein